VPQKKIADEQCQQKMLPEIENIIETCTDRYKCNMERQVIKEGKTR
jgi:hypothetical protein